MAKPLPDIDPRPPVAAPRLPLVGAGLSVLRDPTDHHAYQSMNQSLEKIGADSEAKAAAKRAELIQQTLEIGNEMASSRERDMQKISTLVDLLAELNRPLEALAWRAVQVVYAKSSGGLSDEAAMQMLDEINRSRLQRLKSDEPAATKEFILCNVDPDAL